MPQNFHTTSTALSPYFATTPATLLAPHLELGGVRIVVMRVPMVEKPRHRHWLIAKILRRLFGPLIVPDEDYDKDEIYYSKKDNTIYCHPKMMARIRSALTDRA